MVIKLDKKLTFLENINMMVNDTINQINIDKNNFKNFKNMPLCYTA